ncbi:Hypp170 [Branchiostoma lanceolatum]|uniref:Hypp170 protein n=1 Tax=Branchiostoma lanceolatum TaxID=7740 RepID=A0A8J9YJH2_BRALA|nr:Hypp170 [Branchiostoma lanceolatum]
MTDMACIVCRSSSTKVLALLLCVLATFHVAVDVREAWTKFRSNHRDVQGEELAPNDFRDGNVGFVYIDGNSPANTGKRQLQARQEAAPNSEGAARHARSISECREKGGPIAREEDLGVQEGARDGARNGGDESPVEEIPLQPWAGQDRSLRAEVDRFFNFISSPQSCHGAEENGFRTDRCTYSERSVLPRPSSNKNVWLVKEFGSPPAGKTVVFPVVTCGNC